MDPVDPVMDSADDTVGPLAELPDGAAWDVPPDAPADLLVPLPDVPEGLDDEDREILDFERVWWLGTGPKSDRIRVRLGYSPTRYYDRLAALLDQPAAYAYDPLTVKRLRLLRDRRRRARYEGYTADPRSR